MTKRTPTPEDLLTPTSEDILPNCTRSAVPRLGSRGSPPQRAVFIFNVAFRDRAAHVGGPDFARHE